MQAKGRAFKATFEFIQHKFGDEKLKGFLKSYPEYEGASSFSDIDWYPLELFINLSERIDKHFGFGDLSLLFELGEFSASQAFDTSHKLFKSASPKTIIANAPSLLSSYYSKGEIEHEYVTDHKVNLTIKKFSSSPYLSKRIAGWLRRCLILSNAKTAVVKDTPVNPDSLKFSVEWTV